MEKQRMTRRIERRGRRTAREEIERSKRKSSQEETSGRDERGREQWKRRAGEREESEGWMLRIEKRGTEG